MSYICYITKSNLDVLYLLHLMSYICYITKSNLNVLYLLHLLNVITTEAI